MKKMKYSGSVTVEAAIALPLFILGYMFILSLVNIVRAESIIQYSINQTAKELSQYSYAADKFSLLSLVEKSDISLPELIENISGLSGNEEGCSENQSEVITELASMVTGGKSDSSVNSLATDIICHQLVPQYIAEDRDKADKYLENLCGITTSDIDFRGSAFMKNDNNIKIVAVYRPHIKTFGFLKNADISYVMKNTAVTRSWGRIKNSSDEESQSIWKLGNFERGRKWLSIIKSEHPHSAVASGRGIDLYERADNNTFIQIYSVNVFSSTYSSSSLELNDRHSANGYVLKMSACELIFKKYALKLKDNISAVGKTIKMESGLSCLADEENRNGKLVIVMPEEVIDNDSMYLALMDIADNIYNSTDISIEYIFRDEALGN